MSPRRLVRENPLRAGLLAAGLVVLSAVAFWGADMQEAGADWVFKGGTILTLEGDGEGKVEALAVQGGRVVYAGPAEGLSTWIGSATRTIDLRGGTLLPGFVDAHLHILNFGKQLKRIDLIGTASWQDALARVAARAPEFGEGEWIFGRGWDQNDWTVKTFPTRGEIDKLYPGRLIYLRRVDGHAALASGAALERAGITRETPDPPGGRIIRDAAGEPTGVLIDTAEDLVSKLIPEPAPADRESLLALAARECAAAGLTGIHDPGTSRATLDVLRDMDRAGRLPIRVYSYLEASDPEFVPMIEAGPHPAQGAERLAVVGAKFYLDGAMGSRGAALREPYSDDPENVGLLQYGMEEFESKTGLAWDRGFQLATHAIGDRANRIALDRYEALLAGGAGGARTDRRPRVEHAQLIAPEDLPRFGALGVIPSVQPTHATSDMPWVEQRLGPDRIRGAYAWRQLTASGARLALGSDCPVESHRPLLGIYAAVTRQDLDGKPRGGWRAEECLTRIEALRGFTSGAAYAAFDEQRLGTLAVGKEADMVLLGKNPLTESIKRLAEIPVLGTWVGGRLVYSAREWEQGAVAGGKKMSEGS